MWRLLLLVAAQAFTPYQRQLIIAGLQKYNAPAFVAVLDAPQPPGSVAYTTVTRNTVYIDGPKLECCPRTFANVLHHELDHTKGRDHNQIKGDIMSYSVTLGPDGLIIDDLYVWA